MCDSTPQAYEGAGGRAVLARALRRSHCTTKPYRTNCAEASAACPPGGGFACAHKHVSAHLWLQGAPPAGPLLTCQYA